ncbi:TspO/MBR family protein [Methanonatronarchaeum sp. AMET6-2]|uniref:TspO/MBR family protein n=1 Tax=Methanonatronarchaeum sp. AMET6-2 TaxID=2933293 RepID=UPI00122B5220|nr:TspO/MBR family protein [Methanonatronarchaeum sp. AMET6-2]RZN61456.1 MAG: tryptophan-rich sensory protein [Methanonatronarchaeia archaeon]UOY09961.1 tryptophan-rich sensory protein [Methanonatronarchaeum sp. AMET6-2]
MASKLEKIKQYPQKNPVISLIIAILLCEAAGISGSIFTAMGLEPWYQELAKPELTPPGTLISIIWIILFALMGIAIWLIWRQSTQQNVKTPVTLFTIQFIINIMWSAIFFGLQSLTGGIITITILWIAILLTIISFYKIDKKAAALMIPYIAWVTIAAALNLSFIILN